MSLATLASWQTSGNCVIFFFSSRRRHTRSLCDWSSDVCSSDLSTVPEHFDVLIIGAGLSGIDAAHHLQKFCPGKTYAILEQRERIGGTWDLFRYRSEERRVGEEGRSRVLPDH